MPPGVRYGRSRSGSRERSAMCESIISTYDTAAPNTAMLRMRAPWSSQKAAKRKPTSAGRIRAIHGTLRLLVTDSARGK